MRGSRRAGWRRRGWCSSAVLLSLLLPVTDAAADWSQCRGDAQNRASTVLDAEKSGAPKRFRYQATGRVFAFEPGMNVWSSPALAVAGGRAVLFAGSYDKSLHAIDAASGEVLWHYGTGGGVYAAPVVWAAPDRTRVFAGSSDRVLYALDAASGERLWSHEVESWRPTIGGARLSAPCLGIASGRDAVFVGHWVWDRSLAANMQKAGVTALDAKTGEVLWTRELGDNELTAPLFAAAGAKKLLFIGSTSGTLHALDAETGTPLWKRAELDAIRSPPAFWESPSGPRLYATSKYGSLRALDAVTGQELWSYKTGDRIVGSPAVASVGGRALALVGSFDRSLHAVDAMTGAALWRRATRGAVYSSPSIFDDGKRVIAVAAAWDHRVHAFDAADGTLLWSAYTGQPLWDAVALDESTGASPVAARVNGRWMVYAGSWDGTLYALPVAEMDPTGGSAGRSNLAFGGSLAVAAALAGLAALALTRRARRGV